MNNLQLQLKCLPRDFTKIFISGKTLWPTLLIALFAQEPRILKRETYVHLFHKFGQNNSTLEILHLKYNDLFILNYNNRKMIEKFDLILFNRHLPKIWLSTLKLCISIFCLEWTILSTNEWITFVFLPWKTKGFSFEK